MGGDGGANPFGGARDNGIPRSGIANGHVPVGRDSRGAHAVVTRDNGVTSGSVRRDWTVSHAPARRDNGVSHEAVTRDSCPIELELELELELGPGLRSTNWISMEVDGVSSETPIHQGVEAGLNLE